MGLNDLYEFYLVAEDGPINTEDWLKIQHRLLEFQPAQKAQLLGDPALAIQVLGYGGTEVAPGQLAEIERLAGTRFRITTDAPSPGKTELLVTPDAPGRVMTRPSGAVSGPTFGYATAPKPFDRYMEWSERWSRNSNFPRFRWLINFAERYPALGSFLQGALVAVSFVFILELRTLGTLPSSGLIFCGIAGFVFALLMYPCNVWKHRRPNRNDDVVSPGRHL